MAIDPKKIKHKVDLTKIAEFNELSRKEKTKAKVEVGNFLKEAILSHVGEGRSPVAGGSWKKSLSPSYRKQKSKVSSVTFANLELKGDMLDAFDFKKTSDGIEIGVYGGGVNAKKAFNHNTGDTLPTRRFIPIGGESFKKPIESEIKKIVKEIHGEE